MATPINWLIPDSGPFRHIYKLFRNDKRFANEVRHGGSIVALTMKDPIIIVKVAKDGKTLFSDEEVLYTEWLYGCTGKEFFRIFGVNRLISTALRKPKSKHNTQTNQKVNLCPNQS